MSNLARTWLTIIVIWSILIVLIGWKTVDDARRAAFALAAVEAKTSFTKDITYRRWAAGHGGVYVPISEKTPPSPYLTHIFERDITTPSGRALTLVNPAYMTRQVYELANQEFGIKSHITSLNPLRPENAPDLWEAAALRRIEANALSVEEIVLIDGNRHLRKMFPLITEQICLKCHQEQGYRLGDIRGGISVAVPLAPYLLIYHQTRTNAIIGYGIVWLLGVLFIVAVRRRIKTQLALVQNALVQTQEAELKLQQKNTEMERFVYTVSHDLRAPLVTISGFTGLLKKQLAGATNERVSLALHHIQTGTKKMSELLADLLELSRAGRMVNPTEAVDLNAVVAAAQQVLAERLAARGITVRIDGRLPCIVGDSKRLIQVFQNLIENGLQHMGSPAQPVISIGAEATATEILIYVRDNGKGIPPEFRLKAFELFEQLDHAAEGSGVGLAIVREIVAGHNGRVWIEAGAAGQGTAVWLVLPTTKP